MPERRGLFLHAAGASDMVRLVTRTAWCSRGWLAWSIALTLIACGKAADKPAASPAADQSESKKEGKGVDVEALLSREVQGLTPRRFDQGGVHVEVLSSAAPTLGDEGGVPKLSIPIGSEAAVHCYVYPQDPDPGGTLSLIVQNLKKQFSVRALAPGPIEVVDEAPVVSLGVVYLTQQGKAVGQIKLAFHSRFGSASMCLHDEVGYQASFARVYQSFFGSLKHGKPPFSPSYVEVVTAEINGAPAGYDRNLVVTEKGKRKLLSTGLVFGLRSATELVTQDYSSSVSVDDKDRIEVGRWLESRDGSLVLDVELEHLGGPRYAYRGSRLGKEVKGELSAQDKEGLPSSLWTQGELKRRLAKGGAFAFSIQQYRPSENVAAPLVMDFARKADDPPLTVHTKLSGVEAIGTIDEQGRETRSEIVDSGMKLVLSRAFAR